MSRRMESRALISFVWLNILSVDAYALPSRLFELND